MTKKNFRYVKLICLPCRFHSLWVRWLFPELWRRFQLPSRLSSLRTLWRNGGLLLARTDDDWTGDHKRQKRLKGEEKSFEINHQLEIITEIGKIRWLKMVWFVFIWSSRNKKLQNTKEWGFSIKLKKRLVKWLGLIKHKQNWSMTFLKVSFNFAIGRLRLLRY